MVAVHFFTSLELSTFAMAEIGENGDDQVATGGMDDDLQVDPKYVTYLEARLARATAKNEGYEHELQQINSRLGKLELSSGRQTAWSPHDEILDFNLRKPGQPRTPQPPELVKHDFSLPRPDKGFGGLRARAAPADMVAGHLTEALTELSEAINPGPLGYKKGIQFRPEYYTQHVIDCKPLKSLDHSKMSYKDLFYGMTQVLLNIAKSGGETMGYMEHMAFVAKQGQLNSFADIALISYDRAVVDKVVRGDLSTFVAGDTVSAACSFHAGNIHVQVPTKREFTGSRRGRGGYFKYKSRSDNNATATTESADRDASGHEPFPSDLCYNFNYRRCIGPCSKLHLCRVCRGTHRGLGCLAKP